MVAQQCSRSKHALTHYCKGQSLSKRHPRPSALLISCTKGNAAVCIHTCGLYIQGRSGKKNENSVPSYNLDWTRSLETKLTPSSATRTQAESLLLAPPLISQNTPRRTAAPHRTTLHIVFPLSGFTLLMLSLLAAPGPAITAFAALLVLTSLCGARSPHARTLFFERHPAAKPGARYAPADPAVLPVTPPVISRTFQFLAEKWARDPSIPTAWIGPLMTSPETSTDTTRFVESASQSQAEARPQAESQSKSAFRITAGDKDALKALQAHLDDAVRRSFAHDYGVSTSAQTETL